jgi:hypothetical protein
METQAREYREYRESKDSRGWDKDYKQMDGPWDASDYAVLGAAIILVVVALAVLLFWLKMLVNAIVRPMDNTQKILWVAVMLFVGWIGAIVYYFVVYRKRSQAVASNQPATATMTAPSSTDASSDSAKPPVAQ